MYRLFFRLLRPLGRRVITPVTGTENIPQKPPYILALNHVGFFDGPAIAMTMLPYLAEPIQFLTLDIMWRLWGGPLATRYWGMVRLQPGNVRGSLERMIELARAGKTVGIFPEGGRNTHPPQLMLGKTGAIRMALATGVPLIPVGIQNTMGFSMLSSFASFLRPDRHIAIHFGKPLDLSAYRHQPITRELLHRATDDLMRTIGALIGAPITPHQ
ncbi:MAG: 1-acyl-sn-glycerol-3-phosphate acyltransferase [Candidatus Kerfeldbacteria bacterium]|nr:1-acyl-sn-glycerol-3-phosphate acyltransferase [Candidatus Kerfeldbacteria bacterium]